MLNTPGLQLPEALDKHEVQVFQASQELAALGRILWSVLRNWIDKKTTTTISGSEKDKHWNDYAGKPDKWQTLTEASGQKEKLSHGRESLSHFFRVNKSEAKQLNLIFNYNLL